MHSHQHILTLLSPRLQQAFFAAAGDWSFVHVTLAYDSVVIHYVWLFRKWVVHYNHKDIAFTDAFSSKPNTKHLLSWLNYKHNEIGRLPSCYKTV